MDTHGALLSSPTHLRAQLRYAELVVAQVDGLAALRAHQRALSTPPPQPESRDAALDRRRREDAYVRQLEAAEEQTHLQLATSGVDPLPVDLAPRVLIAHRQEWFLNHVSDCFTALGIDVIARTDNGADAVGIAAAEQPDIALLGDVLAMQPCEEVVRDLRAVSPHTLIGVVGRGSLGDRVFSTQARPQEICGELLSAVLLAVSA